ncbi:PREDICTED: Retrovirus-related Pol poly from [Prunus dulcis]|uniref:PREDICTED: Retrovirus-related Pol poly from n=1 Tax=Prunus dulcis TaxID=3755 RepID=A0A5E4FKA7_PRUDU|nr:PREDICTED: Retrovirus-related Pol poly from [Prunus dulcis]
MEGDMKTPQLVASVKVELKLFTGKENFTFWQKRMKYVLKQQGLSVVLASKEKKSETIINAEWENLDELAKRFIEHHLTDDMLCNSMEDIVKQTWEKIEEMFALKSLSNKLFLKDELHSLKIEKDANMMKHLNSFNRCIADLQRLDEVYKSEDKAVMLLTSVPQSYKHLCTTLMFGKRTLKYEEVMEEILTHHRMVQCSEECSQSEGLVARIGGKGRSSKRGGQVKQ